MIFLKQIIKFFFSIMFIYYSIYLFFYLITKRMFL
jgi:hypothetical protein